MSYEYLIFAVYIYIIFLIIFIIRSRNINFENNFWKFLNIITLITLVLAFIQYFVRIPYPYVKLPVYHGINLFMSNENELGEPLGFMSIIYLYKILFENKKKYLPLFVIIIAIEFINDAKLTILGCLLGYIVLLYLKIGKIMKLSIKTIIFMGITFIIFTIVGIYILNPAIKFRDYSITVHELLFDSLKDIIRLQPVPGTGGSIIDRTNAIIYGLQELKKSNFLGIGWGNSIIMLSKDEYRLLTAKSMHNIIIQFLCEMGIFAFIVYYSFIKWIFMNFTKLYEKSEYILKFIFIISFVIISAQSSIGILSNYYSWIIVFYVGLISL